MTNIGRAKNPKGRNLKTFSLTDLALKNLEEKIPKGKKSKVVSDYLERLEGVEDAKKVIHYKNLEDRELCGFGKENAKSTNLIENVTCKVCKRKYAKDLTQPKPSPSSKE